MFTFADEDAEYENKNGGAKTDARQKWHKMPYKLFNGFLVGRLCDVILRHSSSKFLPSTYVHFWLRSSINKNYKTMYWEGKDYEFVYLFDINN